MAMKLGMKAANYRIRSCTILASYKCYKLCLCKFKLCCFDNTLFIRVYVSLIDGRDSCLKVVCVSCLFLVLVM